MCETLSPSCDIPDSLFVMQSDLYHNSDEFEGKYQRISGRISLKFQKKNSKKKIQTISKQKKFQKKQFQKEIQEISKKISKNFKKIFYCKIFTSKEAGYHRTEYM